MLMVGFRGLEIKPSDPVSIALAGGLGGVILFDRDQITGGRRNISSPDQLKTLTASLRAAATSPLRIAIDQEGGRVSRLNPAMGFPATKTEAAIGATDDPTVAHAAGRAMGATMAAAGIDMDLAPVVDVNVNPQNPAIGALGRSFSADPSIVAAMAEAEIRGLHEAGIRATLKHFPGLGSAAANTDFAVVDVTKTWREAELEPYATLIGLGLLDGLEVGLLTDPLAGQGGAELVVHHLDLLVDQDVRELERGVGDGVLDDPIGKPVTGAIEGISLKAGPGRSP